MPCLPGQQSAPEGESNGKGASLMLIELPVVWLVAINVLGWPVIYIAVAWDMTQKLLVKLKNRE